MSLPKKGQRNQFMFPMIEADGLSVASTLTASQLRSGGSRKGWGYNHNTTTLPISVALSATASLIKSGLFNIQTNAAENIYDRMNLIFTHPTCLDQDLAIDFADYDDSDLMSGILYVQSLCSDIQSYLVALSVLDSDAQSAARQANSRILVVQSLVSDVQSYMVALSAQVSDIYSAVQAVGSTSDVRSRLSDIQSYLAGLSNQLSNFESRFDSRITGVAATKAQLASAVEMQLSATLSDIQSGVTATRSVASDVQSYLIALSGQISDIYSAVQAVATTSDLRSRLSDIQSYLAAMSGMLSDVHSQAQQTNSRALVIQSLVSDVQSALLADYSDLASKIGGIATGGSDLRSRLSDIQSFLLAMSGMLSDVHSQAAQGNSRALVCQSLISDVQSALAADYSDLASKLTMTELAAIPNAAPSIGVGVQFLFQKVRNQETATATKETIRNSAGAIIGSAVLSDDGTTFTKGKFA